MSLWPPDITIPPALITWPGWLTVWLPGSLWRIVPCDDTTGATLRTTSLGWRPAGRENYYYETGVK